MIKRKTDWACSNTLQFQSLIICFIGIAHSRFPQQTQPVEGDYSGLLQTWDADIKPNWPFLCYRRFLTWLLSHTGRKKYCSPSKQCVNRGLGNERSLWTANRGLNWSIQGWSKATKGWNISVPGAKRAQKRVNSYPWFETTIDRWAKIDARTTRF